MAHLSAAETELTRFTNQFAAELTQARALDQGVRCCMAALDAQFGPRAAQLVWGLGSSARNLGATHAPIATPAAHELALLHDGKPALHTLAGQVVACYMPLRARGELLGWIYLDQPLWADESAGQLP